MNIKKKKLVGNIISWISISLGFLVIILVLYKLIRGL